MAINLKALCSEQARVCGESVLGTATAAVEAWLLIEYRDEWTPDIADVELPAVAKKWIAESGRKHRRLRTQLIKRGTKEDRDDITVFLVVANTKILRWSLTKYEELADIDIAGVLSGDVEAGEPGPESLYLVCTHGRRDRCCALHGRGLWHALSQLDLNGELWQSSHQGGHRFAATMLYLPLGIHYGQLRAQHAEPLVAQHKRGEIFDLMFYRGQTRWERPVQAAEGWLREQLALLTFSDVELLSCSMHEGERWASRFRTNDGMLHTLTVEPRTGEVARMASCTAKTPSLPNYYYVIRHEARTT
jgi:hypothetical protein